MELKDLRDSRDRDAMERAQKAETVHHLRQRDNFHGRVAAKAKPIAGYDALSNKEFQTSAPYLGNTRHTTPTDFNSMPDLTPDSIPDPTGDSSDASTDE